MQAFNEEALGWALFAGGNDPIKNCCGMKGGNMGLSPPLPILLG